MADFVDMKNVVQHILDGNLNNGLCRVCLQPLGAIFENIFTKIYKQGVEFSVAEVLQTICGMQLCDSADYYVCADCFLSACTALRFYTLCQRSNEILDFYIDNLNQNIDLFDHSDANNSLCISLPEIEPSIQNINVEEMRMFLFKPIEISIEEYKTCHNEKVVKNNFHTEKDVKENIKKTYRDADVIVVIKDLHRNTSKISNIKHNAMNKTNVKKEKCVNRMIVRRKRDPMEYTQCSKCPVKYRFLAKLKEHMKSDHDIDLQICKVCKATFEVEEEFNNHLKTHTNILRCATCNAVFKKQDTMIAHLKWHESMNNLAQKEGAHICEMCGVVLPNADELKDHYDKRHDKKYTCYYCGKMYRSELSFDLHIKKHEKHMNDDEIKVSVKTKNSSSGRKKTTKETKYECLQCNGKTFVDERALKWHYMLHTNDRPYKCDVCGRGFISLNRKNQHALCAHSAPTKRCPLCPALFHLRSMVNTHIKKVHLATHKRRNRTSKHQNNVHWRTEPVPMQELSVEVQNELLDMQACQLEAERDEDMI